MIYDALSKIIYGAGTWTNKASMMYGQFNTIARKALRGKIPKFLNNRKKSSINILMFEVWKPNASSHPWVGFSRLSVIFCFWNLPRLNHWAFSFCTPNRQNLKTHGIFLMTFIGKTGSEPRIYFWKLHVCQRPRFSRIYNSGWSSVKYTCYAVKSVVEPVLPNWQSGHSLNYCTNWYKSYREQAWYSNIISAQWQSHVS